jgi:ParB-like chromosome segregation protein Spo0J
MSEIITMDAKTLKAPLAGGRDKISADAANALEASLKKFGLLQPIVMTEDGRVIVGDSRRQIAAKLGMDVAVDVKKGLKEFDEILMRLQEEDSNSPLPTRAKAEMANRLYELANADAKRKNRPKLSAADLAKIIGISEGTFRHYRDIARAPAGAQKLLDEGKFAADTVWQICNTKFSDTIKDGLIQAAADGRLPATRELRIAVMQLRRLPEKDVQTFIDSSMSWDDFKAGLTAKPRPMKARKPPRGKTKKGTERKKNTKAAATEQASLSAKLAIEVLVRSVVARMTEEAVHWGRLNAALVNLREVLPFMRDSEWGRGYKAVAEYVNAHRKFGELHSAYLSDLSKFLQAAEKVTGSQAYSNLPESAIREITQVAKAWEP